MNDTVTITAPGKLMLFGEHAVVYGHPCIVTAVGEHITAKVSKTENKVFSLDAPDVNIHRYFKDMNKLCTGDVPRGAQFIEHAINVFSKAHTIDCGLTIRTSSTFSPFYGFGSSSAITVCILSAITKLMKKGFGKKDLFTMAYKTVLDVQGKGSGFDVASAVYGKTILFETGGKKIEQLEIQSLPLIVGYSGVKADTKTMIEEVKKKMDVYPEKINRIYIAIEQIVNQVTEALKQSDWERVGKLMTFNQEYLRDIGVSTEKLESMISAAIKAGAYGAKLSGAGGGDCMIAIAPSERITAVKRALAEAGGKVIDISTNQEGVTQISP